MVLIQCNQKLHEKKYCTSYFIMAKSVHIRPDRATDQQSKNSCKTFWICEIFLSRWWGVRHWLGQVCYLWLQYSR